MCCDQCGAQMAPRCCFCPVCGAAQFAATAPSFPLMAESVGGCAVLLPSGPGALPPKRLGLAVALAALLGPVGLLYSSVSGALYMLTAWCFLVLATCTDWIANDLYTLLITWPVSVAWAVLAVRVYNEERR